MMKKIFTLLGILYTSLIFSQDGKLGVNTEIPATTMDVGELKNSFHPAGLQAPRLTREELTNKDESVYGESQKGALIYITDISGGDNKPPQREEIVSVGYYYFDGTKWIRLLTDSDSHKNIYTIDGALTENRMVSEGTYSLTFEGKVKGSTIFKNSIGTSDNQVSPLQIKDGGQGFNKILTSDEEGNATWMNSASQIKLGNYGDSKELPNFNQVMYTGASIILPKGKWAIYLGGVVEMKYTTNLVDNKGAYWATFFFSDKEQVQNIKDYTRDGQDNGTTSTFLVKKMIPADTPKDFVEGIQIINNTTNGDKEYYLQMLIDEKIGVAEYGVRGDENINKGNYIAKIFASNETNDLGTRHFFAIKIED